MPATKSSSLAGLSFDELPDDALVRRPVAQGVSGNGRSTMYARIAEGRFPAPVPLGPPGTRAKGWRVGEIRAYLKNPARYCAPDADKSGSGAA